MELYTKWILSVFFSGVFGVWIYRADTQYVPVLVIFLAFILANIHLNKTK